MQTQRYFLAAAIAGTLLFVGAGCKTNVASQTSGTVSTAPGSQNANGNTYGNAGASGAQNNPRELVLDINALNNSGIAGKAVLFEQNGKTRVKINVAGTQVGSKHPAHIHLGACPTPGDVKWSLNDVVAGMSTTDIDASFDDVLAKLPLAINIHESAADIGTYVACGDLNASNVTGVKAGLEDMMSQPPSQIPAIVVTSKTKIILAKRGIYGVSGSAQIWDQNGQAMVTISLSGAETGKTRPAYLYSGSCTKPGNAAFTLTNVVDGTSTTTLDQSLANVMATGALSVGVDRSPSSIGTIVSCGALPAWDAVKGMFAVGAAVK